MKKPKFDENTESVMKRSRCQTIRLSYNKKKWSAIFNQSFDHAIIRRIKKNQDRYIRIQKLTETKILSPTVLHQLPHWKKHFLLAGVPKQRKIQEYHQNLGREDIGGNSNILEVSL